MSDSKPIRTAFVSFLECVVKGGWTPTEFPPPSTLNSTWSRYYSLGRNSEIWIVRSDGLRRAWSFKTSSYVLISQSMLLFNQDDVIDEIAVDEDAKSGKPTSKVI